MKNSFKFIFLLFFNSYLYAENISIESKNILIDKNKEVTIFEKEVLIVTEDKKQIKSDYAEYQKTIGLIKLKKNIFFKDNKDNIIETDQAEYDEKKQIFQSIGKTKITTSENYIVEGNNFIFDNSKNFIFSNNPARIIDQDKNIINLDNFEYYIKDNLFKSIGSIKIQDLTSNSYEFSQIYIDTKKKEMLGTDIKAFFNDRNFKINDSNKPRVFANTVKLKNNNSEFGKVKFTLCDYRKDDKCPPWTIQSSKMLHDNKKKTIYYDNAVIKIYDIPIFYLPKLSHPDPSVKRRSGFLPPSFSDTKNLGSGISIPYFLAVNDD